MVALAQVPLNTGQKASALLHGGLILWVLLFDLFHAPDEPMMPDVTEVAIISARDFAELSSAAPPAPAPTPTPTPTLAPEPARIEAPAPITPPAPVTPPTPAPIPTPEPVPMPEADRPQAAVVAPTTTPDSSLRPVQRPAERVAPEPAPTPDPEVTIAPRDQAAIVPDATARIEAPPAQEATQREAAATETVTEATTVSETEPVRRTATAPEVSLRPRARPQPATTAETPAPAPTPTPTPAPTPVAEGPSASAVNDALAQALSQSLDSPLGSPDASLSQSDQDMIRLAVESNWNVGLLSTEAFTVDLDIAFEMSPDARPIESTIRIARASGGSAAAQQAVFDSGRQAIIRAGMNGFGLSPDTYEQWRSLVLNFNPARMSTR